MVIMVQTLLALFLTSLSFANTISAENFGRSRGNASSACESLANIFPEKVFYFGSIVYEFENQNFWSETEYLNPECVFRPSYAEDVAIGITKLCQSEGEFAVRSGGHMGIKVNLRFRAKMLIS